MTNVAPSSALHRLLKITPGFAPKWICSRDSCIGIDVLVLAEVGVVFLSVVIGQFKGQWWLLPLAIGMVVLFFVKLHGPFEQRERWGRARRRRGECVWCGQPAGGAEGVCRGRTEGVDK